MSQIITDHTTAHILLTALGFVCAAFAAGFVATNGGESL